jgi:hypothetical protein
MQRNDSQKTPRWVRNSLIEIIEKSLQQKPCSYCVLLRATPHATAGILSNWNITTFAATRGATTDRFVALLRWFPFLKGTANATVATDDEKKKGTIYTRTVSKRTSNP